VIQTLLKCFTVQIQCFTNGALITLGTAGMAQIFSKKEN
jgi:hypothetical protein